MATILKMDKRLETIVNLCDTNKVIADIGCDHGIVTAELILEGVADKVIATEISVDCLNKAIMLANKTNILPYVSFRECDGFKLVSRFDKVNQAVIAGLGGQKMIEILEHRPRNLVNFVLNPMSEVIEVRKYLIAHKFRFVVDKLVKVDDKYYNIMKVTRGRQKLSPLEIYFGFSNFRENYQVFYEYLKKNHEKLTGLKERFGELNEKNEKMLEYVEKALALFETPQNNDDEEDENVNNNTSSQAEVNQENTEQASSEQGEKTEGLQENSEQTENENEQSVSSEENNAVNSVENKNDKEGVN